MQEDTTQTLRKKDFHVIEVIEHCEKVAYEHKADHILRIDMTKRDGAVSDYYLICTGLSEPHIGAISDYLQKEVRMTYGLRPITVDGTPHSQWIIVDFGFLLIHVMTDEVRQRYALEQLWGDVPSLDAMARLDSEYAKREDERNSRKKTCQTGTPEHGE